MLYPILKPFLFSLDPEAAHNFALKIAHLSPTLGKLSGPSLDEKLSVKVGSMVWKFPVGLAAGLDKNGDALEFFAHQGFGAIECGTVTKLPQDGNPRPRMFRYIAEESLRNAMGFPNQGLASLEPRIKNFSHIVPIGVNMGKNKDSSAESSIEELVLIQKTLNDVSDYFVINVSSPNTPGLRALQEKSYLSELFTELNKTRKKDLFLKIAPDLPQDKIGELVRLVKDFNLTGMIATNTTIMPERGVGGVSGKLLLEKSKSVRHIILGEDSGIEFISVGGISSSEDLFDLWREGGKASQIYTSYVYQGPGLLHRMKNDMLKFLKQNDLKNLEEIFSLPLKERAKLTNPRIQ